MDELHSTAQAKEDEDKLSPAIRSAVAELRAKFADTDVPVLYWNANYAAVPLTVDVELPSRGPVDGVDIRKREPILLLFNKKSFPYVAPLVYSDRRDFSKTAFPHLNVTGPKAPAWFCLHRGSIDTWFAEHTVADLVERARGWLRDAARNRLVPEGDGFEPTRAADKLGTFYYPPDDNLGRILEHWKYSAGRGRSRRARRSICSTTRAWPRSAHPAMPFGRSRSFRPTPMTTRSRWRLAINVLQKKPEFKGLFQRRLFGLLVWAPESEVSSEALRRTSRDARRTRSLGRGTSDFRSRRRSPTTCRERPSTLRPACRSCLPSGVRGRCSGPSPTSNS